MTDLRQTGRRPCCLFPRPRAGRKADHLRQKITVGRHVIPEDHGVMRQRAASSGALLPGPLGAATVDLGRREDIRTPVLGPPAHEIAVIQ